MSCPEPNICACSVKNALLATPQDPIHTQLANTVSRGRGGLIERIESRNTPGRSPQNAILFATAAFHPPPVWKSKIGCSAARTHGT